ncbi:MAG: L,D-transpeptidase [Salinimicrobium sediminis]|nr:L,D-transpeptidase [Salinimicrobium sediminis]
MKFISEHDSVLALLTGLCILLLVSCDQPDSLASNVAMEEPMLQEELPAHPQKLPVIITYHLDSITTSEGVDTFQQKFSEDAKKIIFALNRMDPERLKAGIKLVIPDTITANFLDYSPFPSNFEMLEKIPKTVLISRRVQAFGLYEEGRLVRWGPVSSGKRSTPTPAGLFYGNYKAKRKISTVNGSWIMPYYFNFMNYYGVGVHQYAMPGYPASHACVRLYHDDAYFIYNWAEQWQLESGGREITRNGTPFMVFGDYDFEKPAPWLGLAENYNSNYLTAEEMGILKGYVELYFKDNRNFAPPASSEKILAVAPKEGLETIR